MAEQQQKGTISYDPATTNSLLEKMYGSRNAFPFDTEAKPESERGITSGAVYAALNELKGATTLNKGYWPDLNTLQTGIPVAEEGSIAYVGGNAPYAVYRWASGGWTDTGQTFTPEVSPGNFYTKQEVDGMRQTLEASVADAAVGANYAVLKYTTSVAVTRMQVPLEVRKAGYMIGYDPGTGFTKEVYTGTSTDNTEWQKDGNWKTELPEQDLKELAEQALSSAGAAADSAQEAQEAAEQAATLVSGAQESIDAANAAAGSANAAADAANAAAQSANAAAESIGEKQGAGKPLANNSEVFNDLTGNSVGNASYAHAEGNVTYAWGDSSHAEGSGGAIKDSKGVTPESPKEDIEAAWQIHQTATLPNDLFQMAWGANSHAEGKDNLVTGENSHAGGHANKVTGVNNHVSGHQNVVKGRNNVVGGKFHNVEDNPSYGTEGGEGGNLVAGTRCTVKGHGNIASGKWNAGCKVTGSNNTVNGGATVTGDHNLAFGNSATIEGSYNMTRGGTAKGNGNIAFGGGVHIGQAYGTCNAAFFGKAGSEETPVSYTFLAGEGNRSEADYSAAIGNGNTVSGMYAFAAGRDNRASGNSSSSLGAGNVARGDQSVAAGFQSYALGNYAIALGGGAVAVTEEEIAQIESQEEALRPTLMQLLYMGKWSEQEEATGTADSFHMAYGKGSVVTGKNCLATGEYSSAHGYGNVTNYAYQFTVGRFAVANSERLFSVGNGEGPDNRVTVFSVGYSGNAWLNGSLNQSSDIRLKENVKDLEVKGSLRLREWDWKDGSGHSRGFVADEAETLYPEMVSMNANGYKSLDYKAALCAKMAELEKRIEKLEKEAGK